MDIVIVLSNLSHCCSNGRIDFCPRILQIHCLPAYTADDFPFLPISMLAFRMASDAGVVQQDFTCLHSFVTNVIHSKLHRQ